VEKTINQSSNQQNIEEKYNKKSKIKEISVTKLKINITISVIFDPTKKMEEICRSKLQPHETRN